MGYRRWALVPLGLACLLLIALPAGGQEPGLLEAHFLDVGQGDSCLLRLPGGEEILVDGGSPAAGPTVVAYLAAQHVADIEVLVATHSDADHIGGLPAVIAALPVAEAWVDGSPCSSAACASFGEALSARAVPTVVVRAGYHRSWGEASGTVLNPWDPLSTEDNENSVVLRLAYGTVRLLLTGDAETGAEARMLESGLALSADVLKVAHHGSGSSSGAAFLAAVAPREAVVSVGANPYGHPHADTLGRLADAGARIWRTDLQGDVVVTTRGSGYAIAAQTPLAPTAAPTSTATATAAPSVTPRPTPVQLYLALTWRGHARPWMRPARPTSAGATPVHASPDVPKE